MESKYTAFKKECAEEIEDQGNNKKLLQLSKEWLEEANKAKYSYHFEWLGRPIMQYPQDIIAMQEIIFSVKPDLIIETGIAHGGSVIFSASMLELNAICGGPKDAEVLAIDIDIREHNRKAIEDHPLSKRVSMIQGSSIDTEVIDKVRSTSLKKKKVLVVLDSSRAHEHVISELNAYAPLVSPGSYFVVSNTVIEHLPAGTHPGKPWSLGSNSKTALKEYLSSHQEFKVDKQINDKLLISAHPDGYIKRT